MILIDEPTRALLLHNTVRREILLRFPGNADDAVTEIGSSHIVSESFELTQSVCDGSDYKLGGGVVGKMTVSLIDVDTDLTGRQVNVFLRVTYSQNRLLPSQSLTPSGALRIGEQRQTAEYQLFSGKVNQIKRQKNRRFKQLVAYDAMYDLSRRTVTALTISGMLQMRFQTTEVPLLDFMCAILGMVYEEPMIRHDETADFSDNEKLLFDETAIEQVAKNGCSMSNLLQAYAEANAGFAVFDRTGELCVKSLSRYVSSSSTVTQKKPVDETIPAYRDLTFEEYTIQSIRRVRALYKNNLVYTYGSDKNHSWYEMKNSLFRMCGNIRSFIHKFWTPSNYLFYDLLTFRPYKADVFARWWLEPGDRVQIQTGSADVPVVDSFVFSRTIKGINGMTVIISAKGKEYLGNKEAEMNE